MPQAPSQTPRWAHAAALSTLVLVGGGSLAPFLDAWFWGGDDWLHLEHAALFAQGHPWQAFAARVSDYHGTGQAALRQVSTALWGLDYLLFGPRAWAYYGTNIAVHLLNGVLAYALVHRLGRSAWAGLLCGLLYLLNARTTEVVWFLAVRSEALALTFCLATVMVWPTAREGWRGRVAVGLLFTLALFSKTTAACLPLVLVAHDVATLPPRQWLRPRRLLADYLPVVAALGLYALAVYRLLDLQMAMGYVPDARQTFAQEARTILGLARDVLVFPHWTASYGPVAVSGATIARGWMLLVLAGLGALAWRGPRVLWAIGAAWVVGGLVLPWGLLARGLVFGRYFLPSTLGVGLLAAAALISLERRGWLKWPGRGLAAAVLIASTLGFHEPEAMRFHVEMGRGVESAVAAMAQSTEDDGPMRDLYLVLPSTMRGLVELIQRPKTLKLFLPTGPPRQVMLLGEGTHGLLAERPTRGETVGGVPHCSKYLPLRWDFQLDGVDVEAGDRIIYQEGGAAGRNGTPAFATHDPRRYPHPETESPFVGATQALWMLHSPDGASSWTHTGFAGQRDPSDLPRLTPEGVRMATGARLFPQQLQQTLLNYQPPALVSPELDLATSDLCELVIDLSISPYGGGHTPFSCALEPPFFGVLFWSEQDDLETLFHRHMLVPLRAEGRPERVRIDLRNSPAWMAADRVRRLAFMPASAPSRVVLERVELVGCGFEETP